MSPPGQSLNQSAARITLLLWLSAGVAAVALLTIAVVAWRAADRQRADGEATMRLAVQDTARRALAAVKPGLFGYLEDAAGLPVNEGMTISTDWLKRPGSADDWVFGPWPQTESKLARELREIHEMALRGQRAEAVKRMNSGAFASVESGKSWTLETFRLMSERELLEVIRASRLIEPRERFDAVSKSSTAAGLPLAPMLARLRLELADTDLRRQEYSSYLLNAAGQWPSVISRQLITEALNAWPDVPAEIRASTMLAADRIDEARAIIRKHSEPLSAGARWLEEKWHASPAQGGKLVLRPLEQVAALARAKGLIEAPPGALPDGWKFRTLLDGVSLTGDARPGACTMTSAATGPWVLEVICPAGVAPFSRLDSQLVRQRWLIGGATAGILLALVACLVLLARQRRLNAMMSNFVAAVSHELRAPVGSMGLLAERLRSGRIEAPEEVAHYHDLIGGECRRLSGTIENVLAFSRMERGRLAFDPELCDLAALLRDASALVRPMAEERRTTLSLMLPDQPVEAEVDPGFIRQAVLNLLDNALKFSPPGSTIGLALEHSDSRIHISVTDEGPGIPPAERERIFQPFYRIGTELRRETPGIGIGLAIVKHAVDAHSGSVRVMEGKSGHGSAFQIEFSASDAPAGTLKTEN